MKQVITKISIIVLALIVLFSTFSFTVEKHYCGDFLIDVSYLGEAGTCNEGKKDACVTVIKKKECCKDEVHQIEGQDEIQKESLEKISFDQTKLFTTFYISCKLLFQDTEKHSILHQYYSSPELVFDIQVFHEVFVI